MHVPFFELKRLYLEQKDEIDLAIANVLGSGWYILGKEGEAFERAMGERLVGERRAVVGCNSGTDALVLSLLAAQVGPGDEVITPSLTAIPTITAIRSTGATPVFAEINPETWVLDVEAIVPLLTAKTKAVVAVHLYGNMVDVHALEGALKRQGRTEITIIEDVAQAQGAELCGRQAGTIGRFGAYSFYPSKNIGALGDGGAVFARSTDDETALRMLRNYGQKDRYNAERDRGVNSRLDELQAAVLRVRLPLLEKWCRRKEAMTRIYREACEGLPIRFQKTTENCIPAWHLCVVALECRERRDALMLYLKEQGIDTIVHYPIPAHQQAAFRSGVSVGRSLAFTEELASRIISLPMNACLTESEQSHVIDKLRKFFG